MRATYTGSPGNWKGAIRDDNNKLVWKCPHLHRNRDAGYEIAARQCSRSYLRDPEAWEKREAERIAWIEARRAKGWALWG